MFESEGINGHYYDDSLDYREGIYKTKKLKKNENYYHHNLFWNEEFKKIHETDKAILFEVEQGKFWAPKKLIKELHDGTLIVHKSFKREYKS